MKQVVGRLGVFGSTTERFLASKMEQEQQQHLPGPGTYKVTPTPLHPSMSPSTIKTMSWPAQAQKDHHFPGMSSSHASLHGIPTNNNSNNNNSNIRPQSRQRPKVYTSSAFRSPSFVLDRYRCCRPISSFTCHHHHHLHIFTSVFRYCLPISSRVFLFSLIETTTTTIILTRVMHSRRHRSTSLVKINMPLLLRTRRRTIASRYVHPILREIIIINVPWINRKK